MNLSQIFTCGFFIGFLIGIFIIGLINWKRKRHILNTVLTTILLFSLFPFGFFRNKYVSFCFRQLGNLFSEKFETKNLINGIIFTICGSLILWKTYNSE